MENSHFARIGGAAAVAVAVTRLYDAVLADPEIAPLFHGVDMPRLKRHMAAMLTTVLGGPDAYQGRPLDVAHAPLNITTEQYHRVGEHLLTVLRGLHAPSDTLDHVSDVLGAVQAHVVQPVAG